MNNFIKWKVFVHVKIFLIPTVSLETWSPAVSGCHCVLFLHDLYNHPDLDVCPGQ